MNTSIYVCVYVCMYVRTKEATSLLHSVLGVLSTNVASSKVQSSETPSKHVTLRVRLLQIALYPFAFARENTK